MDNKTTSKALKFDGTGYEQWKKVAKIWSDVTSLDDAKKGPYLVLQMTGKALKIALDLKDNKLENIFIEFDKVFGEPNEVLSKYEKFDDFKRSEDQTMQEYIHEFEKQVEELDALQLKIPELILSVKLVKGACLSASDEKIVRLTSGKDMKLEITKTSLTSITDNVMNHSKSSDSFVKVKEEKFESDHTTFYTEKCMNCSYDPADKENEVFYNKRFKNNTRFQQGNSRQKSPMMESRFRNRQCYHCGAPNHWIRDCPVVNKNLHNEDNKNGSVPQWKRNHSHYQHPSSSNTYLCNCDCNVKQDEEHYHDQENEDGNKEITEKPIFYQSNVGNEIEEVLLVGETVNKAILDSGASQTVCGLEWYQCYIDSLDEKERNEVKESDSMVTFKFGVGKLEALKQSMIPVTVCNRSILLVVHIVNTDIPLLLSKNTMKNMGMQLNFEDDQVSIENDKFDLMTTSSGHYVLPINDKILSCKNYISEATQEIFAVELDEKMKAQKLHRRFAHASSDQIIKLLKNANCHSKELENNLKSFENSCEFCKKHKRGHPRPTVCLPLAESFNELVAMDLKKIGGTWVFHCIDYVTRFSGAHEVKNKDPDEIIEKFFKVWISIFGPPSKILSDNGGEFTSHKVASMCESFNIEHKDTAAESPFSNGICERHNALLCHMTEKIIEDTQCNLTTALMWAVHAKNSLVNVFGFSPYQLVLGKNPNIPGNSTNRPPALSSTTSSQMVADHLNCLHLSRQAFIQAESSDRVKRALKGKIYSGTYQKFCIGDIVYYKRKGSKGWHGPGKVIAQDGSQVLIKAGSRSLIKVHPCKIILKDSHVQELGNSPSNWKDVGTISKNDDQSSDEEGDDDEDEVFLSPVNNKEDTMPTLAIESRINEILPETENCDKNTVNASSGRSKSRNKMVKPGDTVHYRELDSADWKTAKLISRGGKATGPNKNYWNIQLSNNIQQGLNLDKVDWLLKEYSKDEENALAFSHQIEEEIYVLKCDNSKSQVYSDAKKQEIENWKKFCVFEEVDRKDYPNEDVISCRWVTEEKHKDDGIQYKARLVVRGFEEFNSPLSDSPTACKSVLRLFLSVANMMGVTLEALDIRTAFLQSDKLNRIILMKPPKEFRVNNEIVWKLNKPVYGLNDASRCWFLTVKKKLVEFGCVPLKLDNSVYIYHHDGKLSGFAVIHVDDFLVGGDAMFNENVLKKLAESFLIGSRKKHHFRYIGWNIEQSNGVSMDQIDYHDKIAPIKIDPHRKEHVNSELNDAEKKSFQELLGKLQWISSQSRPDIRFNVLECSIRACKPTISDIPNINRTVKKLNKRSVKLFYPQMNMDFDKLKIYAFCDAALSNLPDKVSSTHGHVILLVSENNVASLSWCSKKIKRVVKQILNAECIAMSHCIDEAMLLRDTIRETFRLENCPDAVPIHVFTDSKSLHENLHSTNQATDLKLRREVQSIRQHLELQEVKSCFWVPGHAQLADCLTKSTSSPDTLLTVLTTGILEMEQYM